MSSPHTLQRRSTRAISPDDASGKRQQNKQANRAAILNAARACFFDPGYDAATVRDIVRGTGLSSGTFYNYFTSKEAIFRTILEDRMNALNADMRQVRSSALTPETFIHGAYRVIFSAVAADRDFFRLLTRNEHAVRSLFQDTVIGLPMQVLREDICAAIKRGIFPRLDDEWLAAAFYGIGFEIMRSLLNRKIVDAEAAADFACRLVTEGIRAFAASPSH